MQIYAEAMIIDAVEQKVEQKSPARSLIAVKSVIQRSHQRFSGHFYPSQVIVII